MTAQEKIAEKRQKQQEDKQRQADADQVAQTIKEALMSLGSPSVISSPDEFTKRIKDLNTIFEKVVKDYQSGDKLIADTVSDIASEYTKLTALVATHAVKVNDNVVNALKDTADRIDELVSRPTKVDKVNVAVDTAGLQRVLQTTLATSLREIRDAIAIGEADGKVDLDDYRAHDIINDGDIQYIGFVDIEGSWYIIENKVTENSLRYVFGKSGYAEAFAKAGSYKYKLLSEAVNAL